MRVLSLFDGISCGRLALERAGISVESYDAFEIDKYAAWVSEKNYPDIIHHGDVFEGDFTKFRGYDLLLGGSPCFAEGTMVKTIDGFKEIQDIEVGDMVLTHKGRYKRVYRTMNKYADNGCVLKAEGSEDIVCTLNHRFYTKLMKRVYNNSIRHYQRTLSDDFDWVSVENFQCERDRSGTITEQTYVSQISDDIQNDVEYSGTDIKINQFISTHVNSLDLKRETTWYIIGRYIADGWLKYKYRNKKKKISGIIICCGKERSRKSELLKQMLDKSDFHYYTTLENTTQRFTICNVELASYLMSFGIGAENKHLTKDVFNLPDNLLESFLNGYLDADGHIGDAVTTATSVSRHLIYGIKYCIQKLYNKPCSIKVRSNKSIIEGRNVNVKPCYTLNFSTDENRHKHYITENRYIFTPYKSITPLQSGIKVYNISVEDDESYTANGLIVHNCTFWSGAKRGRETTPDGMGGKLFMEYVRALRESECKYFLYENNFSIHQNIKDYISEQLGVQPVMINSALVSGQQRKRCYWTNIPDVVQPEDKGILLEDIIENGTAWQNKSYCMTATYQGAVFSNTLERKQRTMIAIPLNDMDGKSRTIKSQYSHTSLANAARQDGLGATMVAEKINAPVRIGQSGKGGQGERIYSVRGKSVCLSANGGGGGAKTGLYKIDLPDGDYIIRKLTPVEAERLQTLPDNYTEGISSTQRYKCIGNGWTVDVIVHILKNLNNDI